MRKRFLARFLSVFLAMAILVSYSHLIVNADGLNKHYDEQAENISPGRNDTDLPFDTKNIFTDPKDKGENEPEFDDSSILIKLKDSTKLGVSSKLLKGFNVDSVSRIVDANDSKQKVGSNEKNIRDISLIKIKNKGKKNVQDMIDKLNKMPEVEYAEPNYIRKIQSVDPQTVNLTEIQAQDAYQMTINTTISSDVLVGVIDSGADYTHTDLEDIIWQNPGEIPGDNIDNDNNGYIDDVNGFDFTSDTYANLKYSQDTNGPLDDNGHGTHVSGIISRTVGSSAVQGQTNHPKVKVVPVKVLHDDGYGNSDDIVQAIDYVTRNNIKVINASFGGSYYSQSEFDAIQRFCNNGGIFVAAAGNERRNNDTTFTSPSCYDINGIISVAATRGNHLAGFSNYGISKVDIAAPGYDIYSTIPTSGSITSDPSGYTLMSGTSMAAPHVTGGIVDLILTKSSLPANPTQAAELKNTLMDSGSPLPLLQNKTVSGKKMNLYKAVNKLSSAPDYVFDSSTGTILKYFGNALEINIPSQINNVPVTGIGQGAFSKSSIISAVIPAGVTHIDNSAFEGCTQLRYITIPSTVTTIAASAFENCYPGLLAYGGNNTTAEVFCGNHNILFQDTDEFQVSTNAITGYTGSASHIYIPPVINGQAITAISNNAFTGKQMQAVTVPKTVTSIGTGAFSNCVSLERVVINKGESGLTIGASAFSGCTALLHIELPNNITAIGNGTFSGCPAALILYEGGSSTIKSYAAANQLNSVDTGLLEFDAITGTIVSYKGTAASYRIADSLDDKTIVFLEDMAFSYNKTIANLILPDSITSIGEMAFAYCDLLSEIQIPNTIEFIGYGAFALCYELDNVVLPGTLSEIGEYAFYLCSSLSEIHIPSSVSIIGECTFAGCQSLTDLAIANGVETIGVWAFAGCYRLTDIDIPASVVELSFDFVEDCYNLESINVATSNTLYSSSNGLLFDKNKTTVLLCPLGKSGNITLPAGIVAIGYKAFAYCNKILNVVIPQGTQTIGQQAFFECRSIKTIQIPQSVTTISPGSFVYCTSLESLVIPNGVTQINSMFFGCNSLKNLTVPASVTNCIDTFDTVPDDFVLFGYDNTYAETIAQDYDLLFQPLDDFLVDAQTGSITSYTGGANTIYIPVSINGIAITGISDFAFSYKNFITSVIIPKGILSIGENAFTYCTGMQSIFIPKSVQTIGCDAFYGCMSMTEINVDPDNVSFSSIDGVLYNADNTILIKYPNGRTGDFTVPSSVTAIADKAFSFSIFLTSITMPDNVLILGTGVFEYCQELTQVNLSSNLMDIGPGAFYYCTGLTSITIPGSVDQIGAYAFSACSQLWLVNIEDGVEMIGDGAFSSCENLQFVTVPVSVTNIGYQAFYNDPESMMMNGYSGSCAQIYAANNGITFQPLDDFTFNAQTGTITNYTGNASVVVIPERINGVLVTAIGDDAFAYQSYVTSITIPDSVTSIGEGAFQYSSLTTIDIPASVQNIGNNAFYYCMYLEEINVNGENPCYSSQDGVLYNVDKTTLLKYPPAKTGSFVIPDGVITVESSAFYHSRFLTSLTMPDSVTTIGVSAFYNCVELESVRLSDNLTEIGPQSFGYCSQLTEITIPGGVTEIPVAAFVHCTGLETVVIQDGVTTIEGYAFYNSSSLQSITIPASVTSIQVANFTNHPSTMMMYGYVGSYAQTYAATNGISFYELDAFLFDSSTGTITGFNGTASEVTIPEQINGVTVTAIGYGAFAYKDFITSITIPDTITSIGENAFLYCTGLQSITIPESVETIDYCALYGCMYMTEINVAQSNPYFSSQDGVLYDKDKTTLIKFPNGKSGSFAVPEGVEVIAVGAFDTCYLLTSVTLPDSVWAIGTYGFYNCYMLENVELSDNLTYLGSCAFGYCSLLKSITIPGSLNYVQSAAFVNCSGLETIVFENGVTTIADYAFGVCESLKSVYIPASVTNIDQNSFYYHPSSMIIYGYDSSYAATYAANNEITFQSLNDFSFDAQSGTITGYTGNGGTVYIPSSIGGVAVVTIGDDAFGYKGDILSIVIPDSVTSIGNYSFEYCTGLTTITVPKSVLNIGNGAFYNCMYMTEINVDFDNPNYSSEDGVLYNNNKTTLIKFPNAKGGSFSIPDGVTSIEENAFYYNRFMTSVTMPDSLLTIGISAFSACMELESVVFSDNLVDIGIHSFGNCNELTSVTIPASATAVSEAAFLMCSGLETVVIEDGVTAINDYSFYYCSSLQSVTIPASVTSIGENVFDNHPSSMVIYGYAGSYAQTYAANNGIIFQQIS